MPWSKQSIIVSKTHAKDRDEAKGIAKGFADRLYTSRETGSSYRFRQAPPSKFVEGSFRTKRVPDKGVSIVYGQTKTAFERGFEKQSALDIRKALLQAKRLQAQRVIDKPAAIGGIAGQVQSLKDKLHEHSAELALKKMTKRAGALGTTDNELNEPFTPPGSSFAPSNANELVRNKPLVPPVSMDTQEGSPTGFRKEAWEGFGDEFAIPGSSFRPTTGRKLPLMDVSPDQIPPVAYEPQNLNSFYTGDERKHAMAIPNLAKRLMTGAAGGALSGAATGAIAGGEGHRMEGALKGGLIGAAGGAGVGAAVKNPGVKKMLPAMRQAKGDFPLDKVKTITRLTAGTSRGVYGAGAGIAGGLVGGGLMTGGSPSQEKTAFEVGFCKEADIRSKLVGAGGKVMGVLTAPVRAVRSFGKGLHTVGKGVTDTASGVGGAAKHFEHTVGDLGSKARNMGSDIEEAVKGLSGSAKNVGSTVEGTIKGVGSTVEETAKDVAGHAKKMTEQVTGDVSGASKKVREGVEDITGKAQQMAGDLRGVTRAANIGAKALVGGTVGALGIYTGSKLTGVPEAYQRYKYYKANRQLAEAQLDKMQKRAFERGFLTRHNS